MEIINQKVLEKIISEAPISPDHSALFKAITERYPDQNFKMIRSLSECFSEGRLLNEDGTEFAPDYEEWIDTVTQGRDDLAYSAWQKYHPLKLIHTEYQIETVYFVAAYGQNPEDFFQIEIGIYTEKADEQLTATPHFQVKDILDLKDSFEYSTQITVPVQPPFYRIEKLIDIRRFLNETIALHWKNKQRELPKKMNTTLTTHIIAGC